MASMATRATELLHGPAPVRLLAGAQRLDGGLEIGPHCSRKTATSLARLSAC